MHDLTIIIVSYNSASVIRNTLGNLLRAASCRTLIIDNASPDGSADHLRKQFPLSEILALYGNIGYGRAANMGLCQTQTPYALLLNPDVVVTVESVQTLMHYVRADTANTAIWAPVTVAADATGASLQSVQWVSGSAMLFDVSKIKRCGLFDENIFLFSEDTDLCERTIAAGFAIRRCGYVFFKHLGGQASLPSPAINYMKGWHFGWSQCYRMTKNGHCTLWQNPRRKWLIYRLHSMISSTAYKRMKWKAKADGAAAFIRGEKAFTVSGMPQMSPDGI